MRCSTFTGYRWKSRRIGRRKLLRRSLARQSVSQESVECGSAMTATSGAYVIFRDGSRTFRMTIRSCSVSTSAPRTGCSLRYLRPRALRGHIDDAGDGQSPGPAFTNVSRRSAHAAAGLACVDRNVCAEELERGPGDGGEKTAAGSVGVPGRECEDTAGDPRANSAGVDAVGTATVRQDHGLARTREVDMAASPEASFGRQLASADCIGEAPAAARQLEPPADGPRLDLESALVLRRT